jgi:glycosyltransferase involved in cell wall biosynthesis
MYPKVSVLLTSYNHEKYIAQSVDSVLAQSFTDYELYIVDDCSSDNSWEIIKSYSDSRIHAVRNECNKGWLGPDVIKPLTGEYVAIAHSDDLWLPDKLAKQVEYMEANPQCAACFTKVKVIGDDLNIFGDDLEVFQKNFDVENRNRFEWLRFFFLQGNCLAHPSVLLRRNIFDEKYMYPTLYSLPDFYKWVSICLRHEIYVYPEHLTCFRFRSRAENTSGDTSANNIRARFEFWHVLQLCREIVDPGDLVKIFPSTKRYIVNGEMVVKYAMARFFLEEVQSNMQRQLCLFALTILYELLNDNEEKHKVYRLYKYNLKDYAADTTRVDVFGYLNSDNYQDSTLYFDFGEGFNEIDSIKKEVYIGYKGSFFVGFDCSGISGLSRICGLRFDPDEGRLRVYKITHCLIDETPVSIRPLNTTAQKDDWEIFLTDDPIYAIDFPRRAFKKVEIFGVTEVLSGRFLEGMVLYKSCDSLKAYLLKLSRPIRNLCGKIIKK